jgi:hypothetical protein
MAKIKELRCNFIGKNKTEKDIYGTIVETDKIKKIVPVDLSC